MHGKLKQQIKQLFKSEPVSVLDSGGVYQVDIQSLQQYQLLRTPAISLLISILKSQHNALFSQEAPSETMCEEQSKINNIIRMRPCKIIDPVVTSMLLFMGEQQFILQSMQNQNLFSYRYLLIPSNTDVQQTGRGSHWFLMIYDTLQNIMYTMDSVYENVHENAKVMLKRLLAMKKLFNVQQKMRQLLKQNYENICQCDKNEKNIKVLKNIVKQNNSYDCGIFVIGNIQRILKQLSAKKKVIQEQRNQNQQQHNNINLDQFKINVPQIKADPEYFKQLRIKYFHKALQSVRESIKNQH